MNIQGHLTHAPDPIVTYLLTRATEYESMERYDHALQAVEVLLEMRPDAPSLWTYFGALSRKAGRRLDALRALQRAIELDPNDRGTQLELGETLCQSGKPKEGVDLIRAVFDAGYDPSKPQNEQDLHTIRAGALLEAIQIATRQLISDFARRKQN